MNGAEKQEQNDLHLRRGVLTVPMQMILDGLHVPEGAQVLGVQWDFTKNALQLHVMHKDLPALPEGSMPQPVSVSITSEYNPEKPPHYTYTSQWW